MFFSTHILSDAEMLCDRVAVLAGGKLQGIGSPAEIVSIEVQGMEILCEVASGAATACGAGGTGGAFGEPLSHSSARSTTLRCAGATARLRSADTFRGTVAAHTGRLLHAAGGASEGRSPTRGHDFGRTTMMAGTVAINTFREAVRDRVLYNLIFFALAMMAAAVLVGQITIGIERLVIINLGLTAISLIGMVMAIFIGVGLVYKEIEKRTLYSLLAKPIRRWEFLVGKFAGLVLTLAVNAALMTLGLAAALFYVTRRFTGQTVPSWWRCILFCWSWRW